MSTNELVEAYASEWGLEPSEVAALYRAAVEQERQSAMKKGT